ncbi:MAG: hypothetical protein Q4C54_01815 [Clostridia bacterium]|nr:hypothetical protein [Clostridia bacterium]
MRIDLTCPAEVWKTELPGEGKPYLTVTLYNLTDHFINSVEVCAVFSDKEGEHAERVVHRAHDLDGRPGTAFSLKVPCEMKESLPAVEVIPDKVWFDSNAVWRRGRDSMTEYRSNALPNSRSLEQLRFVAGPNAAGFPEEQENVWLCVCGRPNGKEEAVCARCRQSKKKVFSTYCRANVEKQVNQHLKQFELKARAVREDNSRLQLQREQEYNRKRKKRRKVMAVTGTVLAAGVLAYGSVFHLVPYLRYQNAVSQMESGSYEAAHRAFAAMGDYKDAAALGQDCAYSHALTQLDSGDEARLLAARETFSAMADYKDAADNALEADYRRAGLMAAHDRAGAEDVYQALASEGYKDAAVQLEKCRFADGEELLAEGKFDEARAVFASLTVEGAADMVQQCDLRKAEALLAGGDYESAIALTKELPDLPEAQALLKKAWYAKGTALRAAGDYAAAGDAFFAAGDEQDAAEQAKECLYIPADEAYANGDLLTAAELFGRITGYRDSSEKYADAAYRTAEEAVKDKEYDLALRFLVTLPADYLDNVALQQRCIYEPAKEVLEQGDYAKAVQGFEAVITYEDSAVLLQKAKYGYAGQLAENGDYASAVALYSQLGTYEDAKKNLRMARYNLGLQLMNNEDWAGAAAEFELLGSYKDSADRLKQCRYVQAEILLEQGEAEAARAVFEQLGRYKDARDRMLDCDYALAAKLAGEGRTEEAAALFMTLSGHGDAAQQGGQLYRQLGEEAEAAGQKLKAAGYYQLAGDDEEAAQKAEAIYDDYYAQAVQTVQSALDNGETQLALLVMNNLDMTRVPEKYAVLHQLYSRANVERAEALFGEGKVWEALPYYRAAADERRDAAERRAADALNRSCYKILGSWQTEDGQTAVFREDGTCDIAGETFRFSVDDRTLMTASGEGDMAATHRINRLDDTALTLRDTRPDGKGTLRLTRTEAPAPEQETPAPVTEAPADFTVVDEEGGESK